MLNIKIAKVWDNYILQFIGKGGKPLWQEEYDNKQDLAIGVWAWITQFTPEENEMEFNCFDLLDDLHTMSNEDVK